MRPGLLWALKTAHLNTWAFRYTPLGKIREWWKGITIAGRVLIGDCLIRMLVMRGRPFSPWQYASRFVAVYLKVASSAKMVHSIFYWAGLHAGLLSHHVIVVDFIAPPAMLLAGGAT